MKKSHLILGFVLSLFLLAGCTSSETTNLTHIHGLGYSSDGKLLIPAHDGIVMYENGKWSRGPGEKRDYMGFNAVDNGFYSSGHPAKGSSEKKPLGIVKSTDGGKTIDKLDLYGVEDFHGLAVGYKSHALYVLNPNPNARMPATGLYHSLDDAKTWNKRNMTGINGEVMAVAAHPTDPAIVALVTQTGLFLSKDSGNRFDQVPVAFPVTGIAFDLAGELMIGGQKALMVKNASVAIPKLDQDDALQYISQNPLNAKEMAISTYKKNVYRSTDSGASWTPIAKNGTTITK